MKSRRGCGSRKCGDVGDSVLVPMTANEGIKLTTGVIQIPLSLYRTGILLSRIGSGKLELARVDRLLADKAVESLTSFPSG